MTGTRQASGPISAIPAREAPARSSERQRRVARHHRGDAREPMARESLHAVDRALDLLERTRLSAGEFRILLAVRDGERGDVQDLAARSVGEACVVKVDRRGGAHFGAYVDVFIPTSW